MALTGRASRAVARQRLRARRRTWMLVALAGASTAGVVAAELLNVWRRGDAPLPSETDDVPGAARQATRQTVEVALAGFQATPERETALLNLLGSFVVGLAGVRLSTWTIRRRGSFGPFRNLVVDGRHVHHFVPGIALALLAGGASIVTRDEKLEKWFALPFGLGLALTLDETALLLSLEDVYWSEEGLLSVEIAAVAAAVLATLALSRRLLRRGEHRVLPDDPDLPSASAPVSPSDPAEDSATEDAR